MKKSSVFAKETGIHPLHPPSTSSSKALRFEPARLAARHLAAPHIFGPFTSGLMSPW